MISTDGRNGVFYSCKTLLVGVCPYTLVCRWYWPLPYSLARDRLHIFTILYGWNNLLIQLPSMYIIHNTAIKWKIGTAVIVQLDIFQNLWNVSFQWQPSYHRQPTNDSVSQLVHKHNQFRIICVNPWYISQAWICMTTSYTRCLKYCHRRYTCITLVALVDDQIKGFVVNSTIT